MDETLSFARYRVLQKLNLEFGYNATFNGIFERVKEAMEKMNEVRFVDTAVILHNILVGIKNLDEKEDVSLRLCTLFINEENEDVSVYDEKVMESKIECWSKELDVYPFFQLAASVVPHWTSAYNQLLKSGLINSQKVKSSQSKEKQKR